MTALILLDTSGSMSDLAGSRRCIDVLREIMAQVLADVPHARVIAFGSLPQELVGLEPGPNMRLPEPSGSTALHLALHLIADGPRPDRIVLISDGAPDDASAALAAARALAPVRIDALYAGPDGDIRALGFMKALSFAGGRMGVSGQRSLANPAALTDELRLLLTGPAR